MVRSSEDSLDLVASNRGAQGFEALAHGRQRDFFVRLPGLCTDSLHAVVGQHEMGQAAQVKVVKDGLIVQGSLSTTSR